MKKRLTLFFAAALICGATMLTSCAKEDNPSGQADTREDVEDFPKASTTDQLTTTIQRPAYVFDATYTGEGKAVVARATKKVAFSDESLEVVIMPSTQIQSLQGEDYLNVIRVLAKGGTLVFTEPGLDVLDGFCKQIAAAIDIYSPASEIAQEYLSAEAIQRIILWSETSPFADMIEEDVKDRYEIIGLRAQTVYLSMNDREGISTKMTIDVDVEKKDKEDEFETIPVEVEIPNCMDDYYFGEKADDLAEWLNSNEPETTENEANQVRALMNRAAGDATLQSLCKAQTFILKGDNNNLDYQWGPSSVRAIYHPIQLRYDIWTAYSADKKCDFYCVKLSVTAENNQMGCGPSEARNWYDAKYFKPWQESAKSISAYPNIYGPYMRELKMNCSLEGLKAQLVDYTPKNTPGGTTVTESFSASLGANVGVNSSGPMGGINGSLTWGSSVSRINPDLKATVTANTGTGQLEFDYIAARPIAEYNVFLPAKHTGIKDISITTCTVQHAWVWSVETTANNVTLNTVFKSVDEWLTYEEFAAKCYEHYISLPCEHKFKSAINCPPRNKQEWAMTIEPTNSKADAYLKQKLPQYFWDNNVFFTRKENHLKADTKDEISAWVQKSKAIFDKNNSILKGAAQEGGITGNFTIRWHQTNGTGGTDNDFTYEAKIK
jgi:hypothetical protein